MIRVYRPATGPAVLTRLGAPKTALDCAAYSSDPNAYRNGTARFSFKRRTYFNRKEVKEKLAVAHHEKCCYCELKPPSRANLHIEHYRPKSGFRQSLTATSEEWPGYYWLVYDWENLLVACHDCNSIHKGTFFPLANPTKRARWDGAQLADEKPLFVDPARQNPRRHIGFALDAPYGKTRQGRVTIQGLGLRRQRLREDRLGWLDIVKTYVDILGLPSSPEVDALKPRARAFLKAAIQPSAQFSSMVRDYLDGL